MRHCGPSDGMAMHWVAVARTGACQGAAVARTSRGGVLRTLEKLGNAVSACPHGEKEKHESMHFTVDSGDVSV